MGPSASATIATKEGYWMRLLMLLLIAVASSLCPASSSSSSPSSYSGITSFSSTPNEQGVSVSVSQEYCWPDAFNASCPDGNVILMRSALYGRMARGTCLTTDFHIGCHADVLTKVDARCSGRSWCVIAIPDTVLHDNSPCPRDMLAYLDAAYDCVKVQQPSSNCIHTKEDRLEGTFGYLGRPSSDVTSQCKWVIVVGKGQKVNITLYDFSVAEEPREDPGVCLVYAIIREHGNGAHINVCRGRRRLRNVYVSDGYQVEIQIFSDPASIGTFLLKYEALGCAAPPVPKDATAVRSEDRVGITCNHSAETWYLYCAGSNWVGARRNCSASLSRTATGEDDEGEKDSFPYSLLTAVIIGIIMGIVFGIVLLVVVLSCEKRRRRNRRRQEQEMKMKPNVVDYLADCDMASQAGEDPTKAQNFGQYGYTHVWELKTMRSAEDENTSNTLKSHSTFRPSAAATTEATPIYCEHTYRCRDHMYDRPPAGHIINTGDGLKLLGPAQHYHDMAEENATPHAADMIEVDLVRPTNNAT